MPRRIARWGARAEGRGRTNAGADAPTARAGVDGSLARWFASRVSLSPETAHRRSLRVALVLPYGEPDPGFFPDTLLGLFAQRARLLGHEAVSVRVFYDGRDANRDAEVRAKLGAWLERRAPDVIVVERLFDPAPIAAYAGREPGRTVVGVVWGGFEPVAGLDLVIGASPGSASSGITRRSPGAGDLVRAFEGMLAALASDSDPAEVPGVARVDREPHRGAGSLSVRYPLEPAPLPSPFAPALDHDVISAGSPPAIRHRHLFGNAGCPYAADPREDPLYASLPLATDGSLSLLGCTFCHAGGDYQKRSDREVVTSLIEQAQYFHREVPDVTALVLVDQHPIRYLEALLNEAIAAGLPATRWLFQTRADSFVKEWQRLARAVEAARDGHSLELYLVGFESFSDRELGRYNKGATAAELLQAVSRMRELRQRHPGRFEYARARGHSLVLWSPWTEPDDLRATVHAIRNHGLLELFGEVARNRLRLYPDLPIYHAAESHGALADSWEDGDEGAARRKGYGREHPWRFLDPRARVAHSLVSALSERLGRETELGQLDAATRYVEARARDEALDSKGLVQSILLALDELRAVLASIARRPGRAPCSRGAVVRLFGPCQNRCSTCPNLAGFGRAEDLATDLDRARQRGGPVVLAGREPGLHPALATLIQRAAGPDGRPVAIVTNGRRFADAAFTQAAERAGLRAASVKLFAPEAGAADRIAGASGAFAEASDGVRQLRAKGVAVELRAPLHSDNLADYERFADLALSLGAPRLRSEAALEAVGLERLASAVEAVLRLERACRERGVSLDASPLEAGASWFEPVPER